MRGELFDLHRKTALITGALVKVERWSLRQAKYPLTKAESSA